jgi:hypothetical protein
MGVVWCSQLLLTTRTSYHLLYKITSSVIQVLSFFFPEWQSDSSFDKQQLVSRKYKDVTVLFFKRDLWIPFTSGSSVGRIIFFFFFLLKIGLNFSSPFVGDSLWISTVVSFKILPRWTRLMSVEHVGF